MEYSKQEMEEYSNCFQTKYSGGHKGGLDSCPYCAEVFRRYHPQEQKECECCGGEPTNCQASECVTFGLCLQCCVDDAEEQK